MTIAEFKDLRTGDLVQVASGRIYRAHFFYFHKPDFVQQHNGKDRGPYRTLKPESIQKVTS